MGRDKLNQKTIHEEACTYSGLHGLRNNTTYQLEGQLIGGSGNAFHIKNIDTDRYNDAQVVDVI